MTIQEAITIIDQRKPSAYSTDDKVRWLSTLDGRVYEEIIKQHDNYEEDGDNPFSGYTASDLTEEMLIAYPYEDIYIDWLTAQIDLANADIGRYNNAIIAFNTQYTDYSNWYRRNHMPKQTIGWKL